MVTEAQHWVISRMDGQDQSTQLLRRSELRFIDIPFSILSNIEQDVV